MLIPEEIMAKAEEGGYVAHSKWRGLEVEQYKALLNPKFFQALGKALGWDKSLSNEDVFEDSRGLFFSRDSGREYVRVHKDLFIRQNPSWKEYAHQYFDLLLTGGDTEKFWKELLTKATTA